MGNSAAAAADKNKLPVRQHVRLPLSALLARQLESTFSNDLKEKVVDALGLEPRTR